MKKLLTLILLATLFISCSSSDENENESSRDALTLTRWKQTIENTTYTFQFTTNNYCHYIRQVEDFSPFSLQYRYKLDGNTLSIHYLSPKGFGELITTGTLNKDNDEIKINIDDIDLILKEVPYVNY